MSSVVAVKVRRLQIKGWGSFCCPFFIYARICDTVNMPSSISTCKLDWLLDSILYLQSTILIINLGGQEGAISLIGSVDPPFD